LLANQRTFFDQSPAEALSGGINSVKKYEYPSGPPSPQSSPAMNIGVRKVSTLHLAAVWVLVSSWSVAVGWTLSLFHSLDIIGYTASLTLTVGAVWIFLRRSSVGRPAMRWNISVLLRRIRRPLPAIVAIIFLSALVGGSIYSPNNFDYLTYRFSRILHWWSQHEWHWIASNNYRLNISGTGMEWLMLPVFTFTHSDRFFFLINTISFAFLPGLIFSVLRGLGISPRIAWQWMWLFPGAYCYVTQAGSAGNDAFAVVYLLAGLAFSFRGKATQRIEWWWLSVLAAALLTCAKVTNIPLLLPLVVSWWPLRDLAIRGAIRSISVIALAAGISFLPTAVLNQLRAGQWAGDANHSTGVQISNPIAGILGNTLQLGVNTILPPIFPSAQNWNSTVVPIIMEEWPVAWLKSQFPRLALDTRELAAEESAGLGSGIALLWTTLLLVYAISKRGVGMPRAGQRRPRLSLAWGILAAGLIAFGVFFAKLGSEGGPRLLTPYYPILLFAVLLFVGTTHPVRQRWWRLTTYAVSLIPIIILIIQPARPLFPVGLVVRSLPRGGAIGSLSSRIITVYQTYQARADVLAPVRDLLPGSVREIGFIGTEDDPEPSLWQPFGQRTVRDIVNPTDVSSLPDFVSVSESWLREQTGQRLEDWANAVGMEQVGCVKITLTIRNGEQNWCVYRRRAF
jgi:hypothetical protein